MKRILLNAIILFFSLTLSHCYFNPVVNSLLNPAETEDNSILPGLSLLSNSSAPFAISLTGQIRNENGSTVTDALLTVTSRTNEMDGLDASATTDEGGRFFIRLSSGNTTFSVTQEGSPYFTFTLRVNSPNDIQVFEIDGNSFPVEVSSFFSYEPRNQPSFFEMVTSNPYHNEVRVTSPEGFEFYFTDDVIGPEPNQEAQWLSENLTVVPSITFGPLTNSTSSFYLETSNLTNGATYQITLNSSLRSAGSGIPLTPRTITFSCVSQCGSL
ncbi:carboxypeptidase regulatory-like domain protein [Leptospira yanagawae serovar Saopaulo str. Sao Paulo = ATCC 700523]|uniref:Carboxypeptidase regulatory-like domain protein n=1 Tax=Leptospira yanagawae serovar Saopaulo str. Sao Paulo = ATCC 700523 TaxID=1249483 RepID=A0A5E8HK83_9LEPT|nr:carboxypeptidase-like regulatory domain-containing protein [Leptospira yanagawae]EOQ90226.1 carboxypeptidase regulatory-like domain protein [Leptospira yanagawae serovar Saopaulo str. Sao Paulo = ATCC 700523]